MRKLCISEFFQSSAPIYRSDLIAVRLSEEESEPKYRILKGLWQTEEDGELKSATGWTVDKDTFEDMLSKSKMPIILSDKYIDIEKSDCMIGQHEEAEKLNKQMVSFFKGESDHPK